MNFHAGSRFPYEQSNKLSNSGYDSCYDPDHAFQLDLEQLYPSIGVLSQQKTSIQHLRLHWRFLHKQIFELIIQQ